MVFAQVFTNLLKLSERFLAQLGYKAGRTLAIHLCACATFNTVTVSI